jgi:hypothetical protein
MFSTVSEMQARRESGVRKETKRAAGAAKKTEE